MTATQHNIEWFRYTAPYIKAHRGCTFVVYLGNGCLNASTLTSLIHDLALLHSLGVRLVLVHATRAAIDEALKIRGQPESFHNGIRITDDATLALAGEVASQHRLKLEQLISMGLPNTPLRGARIRVMSGNLVTARPLGICEGVDYLHSGKVRRIDSSAINGILDHDAIALISPLGYSPAGELFSVSASEIAEAVAVAIGADKLIFLDYQAGLTDADGGLIRQSTVADAALLDITEPEQRRLRDTACRACSQGVKRSHLISFEREGALLE